MFLVGRKLSLPNTEMSELERAGGRGKRGESEGGRGGEKEEREGRGEKEEREGRGERGREERGAEGIKMSWVRVPFEYALNLLKAVKRL